MKIVYDFIRCEGKIFSSTEYNNLRNEQNKRVDIAFSHGFTVATITLVFFAGIFAFMCDFIKFLVDTDSDKTIVGLSACIDCLIILAVVVFCGLPNLLILPFSFKFHDNIRVLTNIGAYCKVFYEYPSFIKNVKEDEIKGNNVSNKDGNKTDNTNKEYKMFGWELLHCNSIIPHGNWIAKEFFIISVASMILSVMCGIDLFACVVAFHANFFSEIINLLPIIIFLLLFLSLVVGMGISCKIINKNTKIKKLFSVYGTEYFKEYLNRAVTLNFLTKEQADELEQYRKFNADRDSILERDINNLLK